MHSEREGSNNNNNSTGMITFTHHCHPLLLPPLPTQTHSFEVYRAEVPDHILMSALQMVRKRSMATTVSRPILAMPKKMFRAA